MSGGQDVLGMVAGGASLLSLSVKLAESAATLKRLYHDARNAPEALVDLAHGIETVSLDLRLIERNGQTETYGADLLNRCLEWCQRHAADIQQLTDQLSLKLGRVLLSGKGDIVVREQILDTLLHDLNHAQTTLQQTLEEFHEQEMDRRWPLRATGAVRSHRGHEYSNIAVRDHARLHIGDVYMYGPPSQQTVANPEIYASTRQKRTGESQRPIRGSEDGPYQGNQRSTAMRRAIQTYTDNVTREFGLAVHRNRASLIQELEEVSPRLISSDRLEKSNQIVSNSPGTIRSRKARKVAFRVKLRAPAWFSDRVWEIAKVDAQQGWDLCFRTFNQRPDNAHIFVCCDNGDIHEIRRLIEAREASLLDVTSSGDNLLSIALSGFSDDEIILQDEECGNTYDRHGLVK
jgi:hypothetical protein